MGKHRLRVFENDVPRRIIVFKREYVTARWRSEDVYDLFEDDQIKGDEIYRASGTRGI